MSVSPFEHREESRKVVSKSRGRNITTCKFLKYVASTYQEEHICAQIWQKSIYRSRLVKSKFDCKYLEKYGK